MITRKSGYKTLTSGTDSSKLDFLDEVSDEDVAMIKKFSLQYSFTPLEIAVIAKLLRENADKVPAELLKFNSAVEKSVYNVLTLDEASKFYS